MEMLCDSCQKNEANVHVVKIINGKKTESNLCEACAAQFNQGLFMEQGHNLLPGILGNMLGNVFAVQGPGIFSGEAATCPTCGTSFAEIVKSGKIGCGDCYQTFAAQLVPNLKRIQGGAAHVGKIPLRNGEQAVRRKNLGALKQALQEAIAAERYESAAEIRDQIKDVEKTIAGKGGV
jgi:protein arginine kinase activator